MLKSFSVSGRGAFENEVSLDLSMGKSHIVCGPSGSGKSSLALALADITLNLTDTQKPMIPLHTYVNFYKNDQAAEFSYLFDFDGNEVLYRYSKIAIMDIVKEELFLDNERVLLYNKKDPSENFCTVKGAQYVKFAVLNQGVSALRFVYNNTLEDKDSIIYKIIDFAGKILFFRSLNKSNEFCGYRSGAEIIDSSLISKGKLGELGVFLSALGYSYNLVPAKSPKNDQLFIASKYSNRIVDFASVRTPGANMAELFYFWMQEFDKLSLVIIDDYDAFLDPRASKRMYSILKSFGDLQSVVTTHTMGAMRKGTAFPSSCSVITNNPVSIKRLDLCSEKDLESLEFLKTIYDGTDFIK